jgi:hypothetical protein
MHGYSAWVISVFSLDFPWLGKCSTLSSLVYIFTLYFPWLVLSESYSLRLLGFPLQHLYSGENHGQDSTSPSIGDGAHIQLGIWDALMLWKMHPLDHKSRHLGCYMSWLTNRKLFSLESTDKGILDSDWSSPSMDHGLSGDCAELELHKCWLWQCGKCSTVITVQVLSCNVVNAHRKKCHRAHGGESNSNKSKGAIQ